ncbi:phosphate ABC transporter permease subunit PstC [uncultured Desulfobacter sp.]|uniref:phosphate ABC transporter permease subunit PstC n=1 Tax=uncultured Desulfobacter sp. TaxID=240139 RepID=UPI002AABD28D|nr:phosphate ABC transporter permease subunit PstC [uncultured Desulfobacter sp.]
MAENESLGNVGGRTLSKPPTAGDIFFDKSFRFLTRAFTWATVFLLAFIVYKIGGEALPYFPDLGINFLFSSAWDSSEDLFGILPQIWGTVYSSFLALILGGFFGITIAIFITQDFLPHKLEFALKNIIELLAAIPSVVYGLWGIYVLVPLIRPIANFLHNYLGWIPFFSTRLSGLGLLPAALVLSIMILPTVAAISQDAFKAIPHKTKEAAFGMGTTRWEAILRVMLPTASGGIFGALVLGFGRALGETMALAMLVGSMPTLTLSFFSPADTIAALLANTFPEANVGLETGALMYAACALLMITLIVNIAGALIVARTTPGGNKR